MAHAFEFPAAWETDRAAALAQPLSVLRGWRDVIREAVASEFYLRDERGIEELDECENAPWYGWPHRWHERKRDAVSDCALVGHPHADLHLARLKLMTRYELIIDLVAKKELAEIKAAKLEAVA